VNRVVSWFRPFVAPVAFVGLAVALTVPWMYLVFRAIYERDVLDNAQSLARRVETHATLTPRAERSPAELGRAIKTEFISDPAVQTLTFYDVRSKPYQKVDVFREAWAPTPTLTEEYVQMMRIGGPLQTKNEDIIGYLIPWKRDGEVVGVTYVELSRKTLDQAFWKKEWPLLKRVMAWTATGILALSGLGLLAYNLWQRAGHMAQRAELTRQGLMAERGLTAAVLAHEIRNPLQALRFQLHSLRKNSEDPERVAGTAQTIDSELLRIQQLVSDYLEHEKAATFRVQRVDLGDAANRLKILMDELLRQSNTKLAIEAPAGEDAVLALCDPHALRQVLMNLVLNAKEAMGQGGSIIIRIGREEPFGTIDVIDTGPGIPEEMRAKLFKPFQTTKKEGHGIGLALVKRFVDNFGGSVTVNSEMGRGTTFHLKLPLAGHDELLGEAGVGMVVPAAPVPVQAIPVERPWEGEAPPEPGSPGAANRGSDGASPSPVTSGVR
jgi:signal transduction histidine kinase